MENGNLAVCKQHRFCPAGQRCDQWIVALLTLCVRRHRQKRMRQVKKLVQRGLYNPDKDNPFDLFLASTRVRWTYYKETENILGQTFGMCVLQVSRHVLFLNDLLPDRCLFQDFEALTPNILCRTIETVEGGGLVIILLKTMASLKQLYTMTMVR
jgi:N-acetyltransferase 10